MCMCHDLQQVQQAAAPAPDLTAAAAATTVEYPSQISGHKEMFMADSRIYTYFFRGDIGMGYLDTRPLL